MALTVEQALAIAGGAVTLTTFLITGADWMIRKWLQKHADDLVNTLHKQISSLHGDVKSLTSERDQALLDLQKVAAGLKQSATELATERESCDSLKGTAKHLTEELAKANELIKDSTQTHNAHAARIKAALKLKGALWTQPTMSGTPQFVSLSERRTPIVSVLNLKGGVGKTTLTAYLARALAAKGYRILLIDLDLQGSLSSLFIPNLELSRLSKSGGRFLHDLLSPDHNEKTGPLLDYTQPCPALGPHSRLLPTTDKLAYVELSQTVRWLLRVGGKSQQWNGRHDGRMILRKALHRKTQYRQFDIVLMDCPPIINLCCANALAASDFVLTPITPSPKVIERVSPLLQRVNEVRNEVNEDLRMLGFVVNNTRFADITSQEQDLFVSLPEQCLTVYKSDVYRFNRTIPNRKAIRDREDDLTATDDDVTQAFAGLAEEFIGRLPAGCRHPDERKKTRKSKPVEGTQ